MSKPVKVQSSSTKRVAGSKIARTGDLSTHGTIALLSLATLVLTSLIFEPLGLWPVAFICLAPWLVLVGGAKHAPRVYFYSYVWALCFFLINMRWLYFATGWGYLGLSVYQAGYFPFAAIALRHTIRRRCWPLAVVFPLVWTGVEMVRAVVASGFPWFFLSHSLHQTLVFIQVSDLVGAYGVTFMVASVSGALGDWGIRRWFPGDARRPRMSRRRMMSGVTFAGVCVCSVVFYGVVRLHDSGTFAGPKVAVIQGDFVNSVYPDQAQPQDRFSEPEKRRIYLDMIDAAARERPDVFLLPETPWSMFLNAEARNFSESRRSFVELQARATKYDAMLVTGSASVVKTPDDLLAKQRLYNSATVFKPDGSEPGRYDKVHVVYFGETVPFRFGRLRFLYFWLNYLMPFSGPDGSYEYSIFRGSSFKRFPLTGSDVEHEVRFGIPICYEDVMPYVSREFVCGGAKTKQAHFLLNISNDGWFGRGIQQPQHLGISVFRAVENRVAIARAVNTGISGFIDPSGRIHGVVQRNSDNPWPGNCGYSVAELTLDPRLTLYSRYGDWFAWMCALAWLVIFLDYWIARVRAGGG